MNAVRQVLVRLVDAGLSLGGDQAGQAYLNAVDRLPGHGRVMTRGRQILRNLPSTGRFRVKIEAGSRSYLYETDRGDSFNLYCRMGFIDYEPATRALFAALCEQANGVIDVGAYSGLYVLEAASSNPDIPILAFEPLAEPRAILQANVAINGLADRVVIYPVALDETNGEAEFFHNASSATSTRASLLHWKEAESAAHETIVTRSLDDVLSSDNREFDLVKADVEGAELRVMSGAQEFLSATKPTLLLEALSDVALAEQAEMLNAHGYLPPLAIVGGHESDLRNFIWVHPHRIATVEKFIGHRLAWV